MATNEIPEAFAHFPAPERLEVPRFHQIFLWPLLLRDPPEGMTGPRSLQCWTDLMIGGNSAWTWPDSARESDPEEGRRYQTIGEYEEVVYFHPFVRDFLFGNGKDLPRDYPVRILQRNDVRGVRVEYEVRDWASELEGQHDLKRRIATLRVDRTQLYLFDTLVALLVVEVACENGTILVRDAGPQNKEKASTQESRRLTLADVLVLQDVFRRAYPPFWKRVNGERRGGKCPIQVEWLDATGRVFPHASSDFGEEEDYRRFVRVGAEPPVSAHWRWLLYPMTPYQGGRTTYNFDHLGYQQIEDERIPVMTYLALADPRELTRGDFIRLTSLDGLGNSDTLPYAAGYLSGFEASTAYDAFWDPDLPRGGKEWLTTRYLCCGYGFTMVGKDEPYFFANAENGALFHFRHHYFNLGLLAHFHRASLLMFAYRLSIAVRRLDDARDAEQGKVAFRDEVRAIETELLRFRSRYWFTEVTNQVQGRELFTLWSRHLGTEKLFQEVLDETRTVNDVLHVQEQARQTEVANTLSAATARLSVVATVGLAISLSLNFLATGMLVPAVNGGTFSWVATAEWFGIGILALIPFITGMMLLIFVSKRLSRVLERWADDRLGCKDRFAHGIRALRSRSLTEPIEDSKK